MWKKDDKHFANTQFVNIMVSELSYMTSVPVGYNSHWRVTDTEMETR